MKLTIVSVVLVSWLVGGFEYAIAQDAAPPTAETAAAAEASEGFPPEHLEQLVAPIALYPDALLMQILMAATYPLEVVEADRWVKQHPDLKDQALEQALLNEDWDPSVKSLCTLPSVLTQMSDNLDWTQDLGDAFLAQQNDLLDTVQRMRGKAYEAGNLKTTEQQVVTQQEDQIIVIQSAQPEVVYVPTYSPTVVYAAPPYPSYYYPPMYPPPPPAPPPGYGLLAFGAGVAVGAAVWGDCDWGWGNNDVNIDVDRYNEFNRNTNVNADRDRVQGGQGGRGGNQAGWNHDSGHRKGVNYRDGQTAQKYGAGAGSTKASGNQARGRSTAQTSSRAGSGTGQSASSRPSTTSRPAATSAPSSSSRSSSASRGTSSSAYSGSRSASTDRTSSSRGASSRGTTSYGGSRSGGGRRR